MSEQETGSPAAGLEVFRAPNGLEIFQHATSETRYVYREIFEDRVYFRHGIDLADGECVFDIGANIGLFTLFVKENFPGALVHAFEPSSEIFRVLKVNVAKYGSSVTAHHCGVADRAGEARFTYYPNYSIMSGMHADGEQDPGTLRAGLRAVLRERMGARPKVSAELLESYLDRQVELLLMEKQEHLCRLRAVSEVMDEAGVGEIGLLKVDAEGSELEILAGIRSGHWDGIRQIVMEVHDPKGTARPAVKTILEGHGYSCVFAEEAQFSGSGVVNCYARRT